MKLNLAVFASCLMAMGSLLHAQPPQKFSYQGTLTNASGQPIADGTYNLTFALYTVESAGTHIWSEIHTNVPVSRGTFGAILGSVRPLTGVNFAQQLYLGVTKGSDPEFTPRSALTSSPSSLAPWNISGDNISYSGGRVGIGTVAPIEQLHLTGNLRIPSTTSTSGIIYAGPNRFIHTYGDANFFAGREAGNLTMTGFGNNVGVGTRVMSSNTTGNENTAIGSYSLYFNTTGQFNTATGRSGLYYNATGRHNTAIGASALLYNSTGNFNTAVGSHALSSTTIAEYNTVIGYGSATSYNNGWNNVFVGANVDVNGAGYYNVIAMGQGTTVTGSNTARFGNPATASYGGWALWSNVSDGRFKKNVKYDVPGLEFINKLRPITYNFDATGMEEFLHKNDVLRTLASEDEYVQRLSPTARAIHEKALQEKERIVQTGFVAQEVEAAARELGYDFSGVDAPKNADDYYGLRYAEFVVPLVKAVQELSNQNDHLRAQNEDLIRRFRELEDMVSHLAQQQKTPLTGLLGTVK